METDENNDKKASEMIHEQEVRENIDRQKYEQRNAVEAQQNLEARDTGQIKDNTEGKQENTALENKNTFNDIPDRASYEHRNVAEAKENQVARGENEFLEKEPLAESIDKPFLEPQKDSSIGEMIAENTLARAFPELNINQLDSDHQVRDTDWEGKRSDFFLTDKDENMIGVAEVKTFTGEISSEALNDAHEQLVNTAERLGTEQTYLVTVNEYGEAEMYNFSLDELKEMDHKGFRETVRNYHH